MKKALFSLAILFGFASFAQNDLSITLDSPTAGSTIGPGLPFSFDVTISNDGTQAVTSNDTLLYYPLLNGNLLVVNQNGQNVPVVFRITGTTMNTNDTESRSVNFAGLNIANGTATTVDFCGGVLATGPNWRNVTEDDTTNNEACNTVNYDPNGGNVGLAENILFAGDAPQVLDGSYSDGSTYYVRVYNILSAQAKVSFVDLTGRTLHSEVFSTSNGEVNSEVSLNDLPKGVILAILEVEGQRINTKKVIVE